jgi:crotonobetaine/carnitine-CoA ligase
MRAQSEIEQLVRRRVREHPDEVWLKFKDEAYRWRQVLSFAQRCANGLLDIGLRPGEPIGIMASNRPEFLWMYFGILMIGGLVVPLNRHQRGLALRHILADSAVVAIAYDEDLSTLIEGLRPELPALRKTITFGAPAVPRADVAFASVLCGEDREPPIRVELAAPPVGILYTSGTTGAPKGIVAPYYEPSLWPLHNAMGAKAGETIYAPMPLFHGNALIVSTTGSIRLDAKLALAESFSASRFWDDCRRHNAVEANAMGGVIPILMKQAPRSDDRDNPVRIVLSAGCPLSVWRAFEERFAVHINEFYGASDACGITLNTEGVPGCVGRPVDGAEFRVVDDADVDLPPGKVGEIIWRHPWGRVHRYHNLPEATEQAYRGGWYRSGDLGEIDDEGRFYFRGRVKEAIRRRGENVSAWEVMAAVDAHPDVVESAAFGVPSEMGEEDVMVAVVKRLGSTLKPAELLDFCSSRLAYFSVPRYVEFVDGIPKTENQKIQHVALKARGRTSETWDREAAGYVLTRDGRGA